MREMDLAWKPGGETEMEGEEGNRTDLNHLWFVNNDVSSAQRRRETFALTTEQEAKDLSEYQKVCRINAQKAIIKSHVHLFVPPQTLIGEVLGGSLVPVFWLKHVYVCSLEKPKEGLIL